MKRFLSNVFLYFCLLGALVCSLNYLYIFQNDTDMYYTDKFKHVPENITVFNMGSSHGLYSFNYEDIKTETCFNFALSSQRLTYDERILNLYIDKISDNAICFLPVSYFSFFGKDEENTEAFPERNKKYYTFLPGSLIKDYSIKTDLYVRFFPSLTVGCKIVNKLIKHSKNQNDKFWKSTISSKHVDVTQNSYDRYLVHVVTDKFENGKRIINNEEINALKDMINLCHKKGIKPILVTTPCVREFIDTIKQNDPDFFDDFYSVIDEIVQENNIHYYDYSLDERFCDDYNLFINVDHLNKEGARQFTDIIMDETVYSVK